MRRKTVHGERLPAGRYQPDRLDQSVAEGPDDPSRVRLPRSCRGDTSLKQVIELRTLLLWHLLVRGGDEVVVKLSVFLAPCVQPGPVFWDRLQNDLAALALDAHFIAGYAELLRQAYRLRTAGPEHLRGRHRESPWYLSLIYTVRRPRQPVVALD